MTYEMKPILFNTEMVKAILDGRKTMTRRVMKPQPVMYGFLETHYDWSKVKTPYYSGDTLYVRETWCNYGELNDNDQVIDGTEKYYYRADGENPTPFNYFLVGDEHREYPVWRPAIHMPKEAARLFLRVTNVHVERLQNITISDIRAEGVVPNTITGGQWQQWQRDFMKPVWDNTIKKADRDMYGWNANPWVWVIEFERISKEDAK